MISIEYRIPRYDLLELVVEHLGCCKWLPIEPLSTIE